MAGEASEGRRGTKRRAVNACRRCRSQKIRCSGSRPCDACTKKHLVCQFDEYAQRVSVTKGYIRELKKKAALLESHRSCNDGDDTGETEVEGDDVELRDADGDVDADVARESEQENPANNRTSTERWQSDSQQVVTQVSEDSSSRVSPDAAQLRNPLALSSTTYFPDTSGRLIYLGTSSNWSFGRRVLAMTHEKLTQQPLSPENLLFEGKTYDLGWDGTRNLSASATIATPILPSADFAIYLINAVKFHCGQFFYLFEEESFMQQFYAYHEAGSYSSPSWFVHYLLVLAFGKAFVVHNSKQGMPPGCELFVHAMKLMPDFTFYNFDVVEGMQILCCASLYMQCIDYRSAAYRTIGQALRMALDNGMHTEVMSSRQVNPNLVRQYQKVWWTVYVLDRQMSTLMGVPSSISDKSINAQLPNFPEDPRRAIAVEIQVKLSRILAEILDNVYGSEGQIDKTFLVIAKEALKKVAAITRQLNESFGIFRNNSKESISRLSAYLNLLYHQCIVLTTRPLLFIALQSRLEHRYTNHSRSRSVRALLEMCVDSAYQMTLILSALQEHNLLQSFLPFDLDAAATSAIVLYMARAVNRSLLKGHLSWLPATDAILDGMIACGSTVASLTKSELRQLRHNLEQLIPTRSDDGAADNRRNPGARATQKPLAGDQTQQENSEPAANMVLTPSTAASQPSTFEFPITEFNWHEVHTAEQLTSFAESLDLDGLDWLTQMTS